MFSSFFHLKYHFISDLFIYLHVRKFIQNTNFLMFMKLWWRTDFRKTYKKKHPNKKFVMVVSSFIIVGSVIFVSTFLTFWSIYIFSNYCHGLNKLANLVITNDNWYEKLWIIYRNCSDFDVEFSCCLVKIDVHVLNLIIFIPLLLKSGENSFSSKCKKKKGKLW